MNNLQSNIDPSNASVPMAILLGIGASDAEDFLKAQSKRNRFLRCSQHSQVKVVNAQPPIEPGGP